MNNLSFALSVLSIVITIGYTLYNWKLRKPNIEINLPSEPNTACYFKSPPELYFANKGYMAVAYISLYNLSELPITISKFRLSVPGFEDAFYRTSTFVLPSEIFIPVSESDLNYPTNIMLSHQILELSDKRLTLPLNLKSFDYVEGFVIFPFIDDFQKNYVQAVVYAETARKSFSFDLKLKRVDSQVRIQLKDI